MNDPAALDSQDRLGRIEQAVATQAERMSALAEHIDRLAKIVTGHQEQINRLGKPNWSALGVAMSAILAVVALAAAVVFGPIEALQEADRTSIRDRERMYDQLASLITTEQARNNLLEREMGGLLMANELFRAGRLKLE